MLVFTRESIADCFPFILCFVPGGWTHREVLKTLIFNIYDILPMEITFVQDHADFHHMLCHYPYYGFAHYAHYPKVIITMLQVFVWHNNILNGTMEWNKDQNWRNSKLQMLIRFTYNIKILMFWFNFSDCYKNICNS